LNRLNRYFYHRSARQPLFIEARQIAGRKQYELFAAGGTI